MGDTLQFFLYLCCAGFVGILAAQLWGVIAFGMVVLIEPVTPLLYLEAAAVTAIGFTAFLASAVLIVRLFQKGKGKV